MKCYNHHSADAVGVCKNCSRGICPDCITDTGYGVACSNSCAEKMRAVRKKSTIINVGAGVIILVVGAMYGYRGYLRGDWMIIIFSAFLVLMGILSISKGSEKRNGDS